MSANDPIETLLKSTGRRPPVAADRTGRVRDAVRARWTEQVAQRARRRRILWVASLASAAAVVAAIGLGVGVFRPPIQPETSGVGVERVSNVPGLVVGSAILKGVSIATGVQARVALRATPGHSVRLDEMTTLRVLAGAEFAFERGAIYVDSQFGRTPAAEPIHIETRFGTIEDRGTQFEARLSAGAFAVRVREGAVGVTSGDTLHVARAGQTLSIDGHGRAELTENARTAATSWAETIAPMMEIQERSLRDFLDWVVRERGARLQFAEPTLAAKASSIVLRGSISGMTLDEATASVMATSGLHHRWEAGVLIVSR